MPVAFRLVISPASNTFAFLPAHNAICRYMFTAGFQCNFGKITAEFSAGRSVLKFIGKRYAAILVFLV